MSKSQRERTRQRRLAVERAPYRAVAKRVLNDFRLQQGASLYGTYGLLTLLTARKRGGVYTSPLLNVAPYA